MAAFKESNNIEIIDDSKNTNLHLMALNGDHQELAKFPPGTKIDVQNTCGLTPLMFAARYGHLEAVKALLDLRADATKANKYGGNVFLMAVASGNLDVVNILLQHLLSGGVSRQALETYISPISLAILFGHEHVFKFLLGSKFNVQAISLKTELTPLMFAALNENPNFRKHLLLKGADPRVRNANKETCSDLERRFKGPIESPSSKHQAHGQQQLHLNISPQPHPQEQLQSPVIIVSQQQQLLNPYSVIQMPRRSSNAMTPEELTPSISPIGIFPQRPMRSSNTCTPDEIVTPSYSPIGFYSQVFFPPDFTPSYFASPAYVNSKPYIFYNQEHIVSPMYVPTIPAPYAHMQTISAVPNAFIA